MTYTQKLIELAIKGGYRIVGLKPWFEPWLDDEAVGHWYISPRQLIALEEMFINPDLWQAIGKELRWDTEKTYDAYTDYGDDRPHFFKNWLYHSHLFWDWIMSGKSVETYARKLLEKTE